MNPPRMRFGAFIAPFHPEDEHPTLAIERDFQLVEWLDALGYDEAWIGEHHSAGYEIIASPELFIAAAAERTRRIRLGTGVVSLPYHHPLTVADRINQLDHQARGRVMFGMGPGQLPSDAFMMGIDVSKQRERMDEAIGILVRLLRGETVTHRSDWFELAEARLQLPPYSQPHVEMAVASSISPSGSRAAGKHGLGLLSVAATSPEGIGALRGHWDICEQQAAKHGHVVSRRNWRLVGPMHVAETREQALEDMRFGLARFVRYFQKILPVPLAQGSTTEEIAKQLVERGFMVIGTPDDAVAQIERLRERAGEFGAFLFLDLNAADFERKKRSYELFARHAMPRLQHLNANREASLAWAQEGSPRFIGALVGAIAQEVQRHAAEQQEPAATEPGAGPRGAR
jgi:limonene 1,2-monooxygenase